MPKNKYILSINDRTALARNKRLREAGASVIINGSAATASSGVDEKGIEDIAITGSGNAFTDAALSSDKSLLTLRKGKTFLNQEDAQNLYIRKDQDDGTDYSLYVNTDFDVKGTTTLQELNVNGNTTLQQFVDMMGQVISHDDLRISTDFVSGLLGVGGHFSNGYGEMRGLTLWEWLEVPELRYNRVTVNTGITWQTFGGGIIESVEQINDNEGTITLKLEEGEIGAIAVDDLCMGIYHNYNGENDDYNDDSHDGNFHFAGFKTVYFRVTEIIETSDNSKFNYIIRSADTQVAVGNWSEHNHPTAAMHFAAYASADNDPDSGRHECHYSSTKYLISLHNMTSWEYGSGNIYYIRGELDGFTVGNTQLAGTGIYIGNGYFSGMLQQIENAEYVMDLGLDVGETILLPSETRTIAPTITRAFTDYTEYVATWSVVRESSDVSGDAEWNARHADFAGVLETSFDDLLGDDLTNAMLTFAAVLDDDHSSARVTCSAVFRYVQGEDAIYPVVSADNLVFAEGETEKSFTINVYKGREQVALTTSNVTFASVWSPYSVSVSASEGTITATISRGSAIDLPSISYTITAEDVTFSRSIALNYVFNGEQGEQGEQGEPGENAIYYELVLSSDSLHYNAAAGAYAPESVTMQVQKVEGDERSYVSFSSTISAVRADGSGTDTSSVGGSAYIFTPTIVYSEIHFNVTNVEGRAYPLEKVIYPTSSFMPRLQNWEDVADGFTFEAGVVGDMFIDCVIYPKTNGNYFVCIKGHDKSSSNAPTQGAENEWWKPMNKFDNVATDLLLADTAKIDNLYVDDVYMEGNNTAIWINPNQDGIKINDVARLENKGRESSTWTNPTAYFHGTAIPDPADIYSGSGSGSSALVTCTIATNGSDIDMAATEGYVGTPCTFTDISKNKIINVTINPCQFAITEGDIEGNESRVRIELRATHGDTTTTIWQRAFSGEKNTTYYYTIAQQNVSFITNGTSIAFQLYVVSGYMRPGFTLAFNGSGSGNTAISYDIITKNYISQYGANGLFIGQKSDTYFRAKVEVADDDTNNSAYDMLAEGYGLSITPSGSLQQVAGSVMPLGGCLAMGSFTVSDGAISGCFRAFNSGNLTITYQSAGRFLIGMPTAWASLFGGSSSEDINHFVPIVTLAEQSQDFTAFATVSNNSSYWKGIRIVTKHNGTDTDPNNPIHFRIDYMGNSGLQTLSSTSINETQETT